MTDRLLVGIDAGLTTTKAVAFTPDGREVASASRETPGLTPAPDREEQDHEDLWTVVASVVEDVVNADAVDPGVVEGVGVAGHGHGLYALDDAGEPALPGIKSTDSRAMGLVDRWESDGTLAAVRETLGWEPFGADPLSLLAWLRREDPDAYDRVDRLLFCKDVVTHRLTGRAATDRMEASVFEGRDGEVAAEAFDRLGIGDAVSAIPDAVPSTDVTGTVTTQAAAQMGLPEGTPVAAGLHDVGACALGSGAIRPGHGVLIVGTWGQSIAVSESPSPADAPGISRRYLDGWLTYRGTRSAAACVDWFTRECGADWQEAAAERGIDEYAFYDERIAEVDPGSDGLVFHPFLRGSTDDPGARAGFYGLRADHGKAHMLRAVYEGVAIDLCGALGRLEPDGGFDDVRVTGGGARSEVWADIFADVLGDRVSVPHTAEVGALGAALCAGVAADVYRDAGTAVTSAVSIARNHEPTSVSRYRRVRDAFEQAYDGLGPVWETLDAGRGPDA